MLEYIFAGTDVMIKLVHGRHKGNDNRNNTSTANSTSKSRRKKEETIIIRTTQGNSYADLLKKVKKDVDLAAAGVEIKTVRKTRKGDLLVTLDKDKSGKDQAIALKAEIVAKMQDVKVDIKTEDTRTLYIVGMDAVTTDEELTEAIKVSLPLTDGAEANIKINAMWPTYRGNQNAAIVVGRAEAKNLLQNARLKIG